MKNYLNQQRKRNLKTKIYLSNFTKNEMKRNPTNKKSKINVTKVKQEK